MKKYKIMEKVSKIVKKCKNNGKSVKNKEKVSKIFINIKDKVT